MQSRLRRVLRGVDASHHLPALIEPAGDDTGFGGATASPAGAPVSGQTAPSNAVTKSLQLPLPENDPIPQSTEFEFSGTVSTAAPGISAIPLDDGTGNPFQLAPGELARIASVFLIVAGSITVATEQLFTLLINRSAVRGWANRVVIPTPSNGYTQPFYAKVLVPNSALVTVTVNNADGGSYIDGIMMTGWRWPEASGRAWNRGRGQ